MDNIDEIVDSLLLELRRGTLVLSVLTQLQAPQYGYSLVQRLADKGLNIEQNTLYPLLRRLEKTNLLDSNWSVEEPRPRRYYCLSETGQLVLSRLTKEWRQMNAIMEQLFQEV